MYVAGILFVLLIGGVLASRVWGGAGVLFWCGICLGYLVASRMSTAWYGVKIFAFAMTGVGLILGGGSILANSFGEWAVVPWFVACVVFLWRLRKKLFQPIW